MYTDKSTISCPHCTEEVYSDMLDRHIQKDHHVLVARDDCPCDECRSTRYMSVILRLSGRMPRESVILDVIYGEFK